MAKLTRREFGNTKFLAGQFYFHALRVFKVMFTAIITAAAGGAILTATGLLGMELSYVPETFLIPHLVGGLVLGAGFMLSAYCPGTSILGAASGKWDGVVTVAGVIAGSVAFGETGADKLEGIFSRRLNMPQGVKNGPAPTDPIAERTPCRNRVAGSRASSPG
jgi:hypothetical protein